MGMTYSPGQHLSWPAVNPPAGHTVSITILMLQAFHPWGRVSEIQFIKEMNFQALMTYASLT